MVPPVIRWGFLGTGNIAGKYATALAALGSRAQFQAVGSRSLEQARLFAARHGAVRAHGSYEALLADPEVDAVYIALPNHLHAHWAIRAAACRKHILCEKPAAMHARELAAVLAAVGEADVAFVEGWLYRFHPRYVLLRRLLAEGVIGEPRMLQAQFCFDAGVTLKPRLAEPAQGGGALMDVGVYPVSWLRWIAGAEPLAVECAAHVGASGVDELVAGALRFPGGLVAGFACAVRCAQPSVAVIAGSRGTIEVIEPWRCTPGVRGLVITGADGAQRLLPTPDDGLPLHAYGLLALAEAVDTRQHPLAPWDDSLGNQVAIDQLRHRCGVWWPGEQRT